jgi:hypothetical protein
VPAAKLFVSSSCGLTGAESGEFMGGELENDEAPGEKEESARAPAGSASFRLGTKMPASLATRLEPLSKFERLDNLEQAPLPSARLKARPGLVGGGEAPQGESAVGGTTPGSTAPEAAGSIVCQSASALPAEATFAEAETVTEAETVSEDEVTRVSAEALRAVEEFAVTRKRHTAALKKVNDFIGSAFSWFEGDESALASVQKVAASVDSMLSKLENWDQAPAWIRSADRSQIMQRNGFDSGTMEKFDQWFQSQNKPFSYNKNMPPDRRLMEIQEHLARRVAVESVKNWLRMAPEVEASVSPVVKEGFELMAGGTLPDGRSIPKGSDLIVFEKLAAPGSEGDAEMVVPFARDGKHVQRFDDTKIAEGLRKLSAMISGGPQALSAKDLYGFRLDHDPSRLLSAGKQVGFAILRPGGHYGKNVMYMQFSEDVDPSTIPRSLHVDGPSGPGTNTGVLYNLVRNAFRRSVRPPSETQE